MVQLETQNDMGPTPCALANGKTAVFTTIDVYAIFFTWNCQKFSHKLCLLKNLGATNKLTYRIKGYVQIGSVSALDVGSSPWTDIVLNPGDSQPLVLENAWGQVTFEIKSTTAALPTTCELEYSGN